MLTSQKPESHFPLTFHWFTQAPLKITDCWGRVEKSDGWNPRGGSCDTSSPPFNREVAATVVYSVCSHGYQARVTSAPKWWWNDQVIPNRENLYHNVERFSVAQWLQAWTYIRTLENSWLNECKKDAHTWWLINSISLLITIDKPWYMRSRRCTRMFMATMFTRVILQNLTKTECSSLKVITCDHLLASSSLVLR